MEGGGAAAAAEGHEQPPPLGLCVLCGLPAAGKSTLARALRDGLRRGRGWGCVVITYDDVIPEDFLQGGAAHSSSPWKRHRHELLSYLELLVAALAGGRRRQPSGPGLGTDPTWGRFVACLRAQGLGAPGEAGAPADGGKTAESGPFWVVLDDNFYYRSMRYEVYRLARKYALGFCQLFLDCPLESCLQRNRQRSRPLPDETLFLMTKKLEIPNPEKNVWERNSLTITSFESNPEDNPEVTHLLLTALENPVKYFEDNSEQKETDRIICSTNVLHQADKTFRGIISQTMKTAKENYFSFR
ncbi:L-seryl-tRNA(Sec) kinase isoform X2 [Ornithorhynchus anatinus]|uniref:L-seryl-tRNA(Sec) kinase isoform X2 n=1 Tax=Ornithorhynchus anatinus TaxID=9258 RepID=UPI0010A926A6|nr:L-seryl-tRNA(Sec) kinase isoform X2 [Ornithorhynchus anatinus]